MTIIGFTTITDPNKRQDPWMEAICSWAQVCDRIVVVDGKKSAGTQQELTAHHPKLEKQLVWQHYSWPDDWDWTEIPKHMNHGLSVAKLLHADWAIRFDADWIFNPIETKRLRQALLHGLQTHPLASLQKFSTVLVNSLYQKGAQPIAINLHAYPKIVLGKNIAEKTDLCYPIRPIGRMWRGVPEGDGFPDTAILKTGVPFYNYDYCFKTETNTRREFFRFSKAYFKTFGTYWLGDSEQAAIEKFIVMMQGRLKRSVYSWETEDHPRPIRAKVSSITPEQFGYSGWGKL